MIVIGVLLLSVIAVPLYGSQKVLVMPLSMGRNSHLLNMEKVANILADSGYDVTILTNSATRPHITSTKAAIREVKHVYSVTPKPE